MSGIELLEKVRSYKELKLQLDAIQDALDAIKGEITAEMAARQTEEMTVDLFKVRNTIVISNRFDSTAFKKDHPDIYTQYVKETIGTRFTIA